MEQIERVVDLSFPVRGPAIPADHGYALFAALCRHLPRLHGDESVGVHAVNGRLAGDRRLALTDQSRLTLRLPADRIVECIELAGQQLDVEGSAVRLGLPSIRPMLPTASLYSRLVVIRGFMEPEPFIHAIRRQLGALAVVEAVPSLVLRPATGPAEGKSSGGAAPWVRRTVRIRDREIVGYAVRIDHLTAAESVRVQEHGLGGRRRFGCGLFLGPARVER